MLTRRSCLAAALAIPFAAAFAAAADKMTFEIFTDAKDEFRWRLLDGDGKKADCTKMVENFKDDISRYTFELYEDNKKEQRFRLKARNGNVVGSSTGSYKTKADAEKTIAAIKSAAKDATVKEVEKEKK